MSGGSGFIPGDDDERSDERPVWPVWGVIAGLLGVAVIIVVGLLTL